jgi:hypothetical protein
VHEGSIGLKSDKKSNAIEEIRLKTMTKNLGENSPVNERRMRYKKRRDETVKMTETATTRYEISRMQI